MKNNLLSATQIAALKKRFERCKTQILALEWVTQGSLSQSPQGNWRWTRKLKAKTVTVALSDKQAELFRLAIEGLKTSSTRCALLASRCSSTPSKGPHVEKEEFHPKCALTSRHSGQAFTYNNFSVCFILRCNERSVFSRFWNLAMTTLTAGYSTSPIYLPSSRRVIPACRCPR